jgi:predicted permease
MDDARRAPTILWIDCLGGLIAGVLVLALAGWLAPLEGVPRGVLLFTGAMNLVYGSYSLSLVLRRWRSRAAVYALVAANAAWLPVCLVLTALCWGTITVFGILHLVGEGVYVGGLALAEWRQRERLVTEA